MSILNKSLLAGLAIIATGSAFAQQIEPPITYSVGVESYKETYKEFGDGTKFMQEQGPMKGIVGQMNIPVADDAAVKLSLGYASGKSEYTGSLMTGTYGDLVVNDIPRERLEFSGVYLWDLTDTRGFIAGIGGTYRQLTDKMNTVSSAGYKRQNQLITLDLSASKNYYTNYLVLTPKIELKVLLSGKQRSYVDFMADGGTLDHEQKSGFGLNFEYQIKAKLDNNYVSIIPYAKYMEISKSDSTYLIDTTTNKTYDSYEPKNKTTEMGVKVLYSF